MPKRKKNERLWDYAHRCAAVRQKEGKDKSRKQSLAVCRSMGTKKKWKE